MNDCRFCKLANEYAVNREEDTIIFKDEKYFSISSIGALVVGWILLIPEIHVCSMKDIYVKNDFKDFANKMLGSVQKCYGRVIVFEHGPNRMGSETSCGTNHAHLHIVPFESLKTDLYLTDMQWMKCRMSEIGSVAGENEYLFYAEFAENEQWEDKEGLIHILKQPISQYFRKVIAKKLNCLEKYNYKENPDTELTIKTVNKLCQYFSTTSEENHDKRRQCSK